MGQKDTTEKLLMDYNDVFADVVNGLLCKGEQVVQPCDLVMSQPISQYKATVRFMKWNVMYANTGNQAMYELRFMD